MATAVGSIDGRQRPLIRIELPGGQDDIVALLDTGFNGALFIDESDAPAFGIELREAHSTVELAGRVPQLIRRGTLLIAWLGEQRRIEVIAAVAGATGRPKRPDDPTALVGTLLLSPHLLLIDFKARTIEIEAQY